MTVAEQAISILKAGGTRREVQDRLKIGALEAQKYCTLWRCRTGDSRIHHPEKAGQVARLLGSRRGLAIYETNGYLGEVEDTLGHLNRAWREHGTVTARGPKDGHQDVVTRREIESGRTYDVVDADVYSGVHRLLQLGLVKLVRPGGLLICTWPSSGMQCLNPKLLQELFGHTSQPTSSDFFRYTERSATYFGRRLLKAHNAEQFGRIHRIPVTVL